MEFGICKAKDFTLWRKIFPCRTLFFNILWRLKNVTVERSCFISPEKRPNFVRPLFQKIPISL